MYLVKDTPIRKNNKTYKVGCKFPYSDKDKTLLLKGYLKEVEETKHEQQVADKKTSVEKTQQPLKEPRPSTDGKTVKASKKPTVKKTNSKKK